MQKTEQYERSAALTRRRLFGYSFLISTPVYYLWLVFSLIPIAQYEVWLMTGFPLVIVTGLTLSTVAERWKGRRLLFWSMQLVIYLGLLIGGQLTVSALTGVLGGV